MCVCNHMRGLQAQVLSLDLLKYTQDRTIEVTWIQCVQYLAHLRHIAVTDTRDAVKDIGLQNGPKSLHAGYPKHAKYFILLRIMTYPPHTFSSTVTRNALH